MFCTQQQCIIIIYCTGLQDAIAACQRAILSYQEAHRVCRAGWPAGKPGRCVQVGHVPHGRCRRWQPPLPGPARCRGLQQEVPATRPRLQTCMREADCPTARVARQLCCTGQAWRTQLHCMGYSRRYSNTSGRHACAKQIVQLHGLPGSYAPHGMAHSMHGLHRMSQAAQPLALWL
jgi:hypothetical protein